MPMSNEELAVRAEILSVASDSVGETEICRMIASRLRAIDGLVEGLTKIVITTESRFVHDEAQAVLDIYRKATGEE